LQGKAITNACVVHLGMLRSLEVLAIENSRITSKGFARLQKLIPGLEIRKGQKEPRKERQGQKENKGDSVNY
jgi:hypothetical protein